MAEILPFPAGHRMTNPEAIMRFVLAGRAHVTIQSQKTNAHFTYRVNQARDKETGELKDFYFVSKLGLGSADDGEFLYIGYITNQGEFRITPKSRLPRNSKPVKAWEYFWKWLLTEKIGPDLSVFHEGNCGRCGRTLTHPESIELGIGPECANIMGLNNPGLPDDEI